MNNIDQVEKLIETYKIHLKKDRLKDELYKWQLLAKFKGRPRLDALNFAKEITSINFANLIYHSGITVIKQLAEVKSESYKNCFESLFDEKSSLTLRTKAFDKTIHTIYRELYANHEPHHDERTMSTFLTFHNPEKYTLYKNSFYKKYCQLLGIATKEKGEKYEHYLELVDDLIENYIKKDAELITIFQEIISSEDCYEDPNFKILAQDILYQMLEKPLSKSINYWRIGTTDDKNNSYWDFMRDNERMCIGWHEIGDLEEVNVTSKATIQELFERNGFFIDDKRSQSRKAGEIYNFYAESKIGDIVLAQRGANVLGIGIVADDYQFEHESDFAHQKIVKWKIENPDIVNKEGLQTTFVKLSDPKLLKQIDDSLKIIKPKINMANNQPLNQILFGPPGTGKTYSTVEYAYKIINGDDAFIKANDYDKAKQWFKEELAKADSDDRQLDFITFHQNYSYEDFVMGIKPDLNEGDGLSFTRHEGIFYKICQRALKNLKQSSQEFVNNNSSTEEVEDIDTSSEEFTNVKPSFEKVFAELTKPLNNRQKVHILTKNAFFDIYNIVGNRVFYYQQDGESRKLSLKIIKALYEGNRLQKEESLNVYYNPLNERLQKIADTMQFNTNANLKIESLNERKQEITIDNPKKSIQPFQKNYVIIIDEINRANISRVFGELITLIEDDKRWGNEHAMELRLPDGHTKFTVPKNLYIIGTMNTADKSIALLDIALRRRFEFTALYPDDQLVNEKYRTFFEALNKDIIAKKGIDFTIGHSYFMTKNGQELDFVKTMNKKVIPLLCEYFYNIKDNKVVVKLIEDALSKASLSNKIVPDDYQIYIQ